MKTDRSVDRALGVRLRWLVSDKAVARWQDQDRNARFLGQATGLNQKACFTLLLGQHPDNEDDQILLLYLPLRPQASMKTQTYDLLLVVPADHFDPHNPVSAANMLPKDVPTPVQNTLGRSDSATPQRIMRVQLRLRNPGFVLMPATKPANPVTGTPRDLLLGLRSLSQTLIIDAFVATNVESQVALLRLGTRLRQAEIKTSPLHFRSMFGGKGAKRDNWAAFGLDSNASEVEAFSTSPAGDAPPAYAEAVQNAKTQRSAADSSCGPGSPDPEGAELEMTQSCTSLVPTQPDTSSDIQVRQSPAYRHTTPDVDDNQSVDTVVTETSLEEAEKAGAAVPVISQRKRHRLSSSDDDSSVYAATFIHKRRATSLSHKVLHPIPTPGRHDRGTQTVLPLDPRDASSILYYDESFLDMACWLVFTWSIDRESHIKLRELLLAIGYYVKKSRRADYYAAKGRCMALLLLRPAVESVDKNPPVDFAKDVAETIAWANSIRLGAEQILFDSLRTLCSAAYERNTELYLSQKAYWIACLFCLAGEENHVAALITCLDADA